MVSLNSNFALNYSASNMKKKLQRWWYNFTEVFVLLIAGVGIIFWVIYQVGRSLFFRKTTIKIKKVL